MDHPDGQGLETRSNFAIPGELSSYDKSADAVHVGRLSASDIGIKLSLASCHLLTPNCCEFGLKAEYPKQVDRLVFTPVEGGCKVHHPENDRVHHLNATAATILLLCDGRHSVTDIALLLHDNYNLAAPPADDIKDMLSEFEAEGLVIAG